MVGTILRIAGTLDRMAGTIHRKAGRVTRGEMGIFCDIFINYSKHMALLNCFNDGSEH